MKICVIGAGYVGLVSSVGFALGGHTVKCVDKDAIKIKALKKAQIPIFEKGLEAALNKVLKKGLIEFSTNTGEAVESSGFIFIAVGTPEKRSGACDLRSVNAVVQEIASYANEDKIVVMKSTVPVGTSSDVEKTIAKILAKQKKSFKISVVSNPEFLRQGNALENFLKPDRIVIGASNKNALTSTKELYGFIKKASFIQTSRESAELVKYASNAFLATKISFINEVANLCDKTGGDVTEVAAGMGKDPRINPYFLNAGIGYGGSCFPKDTKALNHIAKDVGNGFKLLEAVIEVNKVQKFFFIDKIKKELGGITGKHFGVLGLAFKGGTDDVRESVSLEICKILLDKKSKIKAYDPQANANAKKILPKITLCENAYEAITGSDAILLLCDWKEFLNLDLKKIKRLTKKNYIFDGKNFLDPKKIRKAGFKYFGVGRVSQNND